MQTKRPDADARSGRPSERMSNSGQTMHSRACLSAGTAHICHSEERSDEESGDGWHWPLPAARFLASLGMTSIGAPMQTKRMSNGGPTMRSRARLTGV